MKRGYFVSGDADYGIAVVAESAKEAKNLGYHYSCEDGWDWEYIDVKVKWKKEANVEGLPLGVVRDLVEGLKRDFYDFVEEAKCPICKEEHYLTKEGEVVGCTNCIDKGLSKGDMKNG